MASDRQITANRQNAKRSTGPKTPEGKARASLNAVRHGLLARQSVIPEEDRADYLDLLAALEAEHQPQSPLETFLVHQMASAQWRLERLTRIETGFFVARMNKVHEWEYGKDDEEDSDEDEAAEPAPEHDYDEDTRLLGVLFHEHSGGDPFAKLSRYQTTLQRLFFRSLTAFLDARARRMPPPPEPPSAPNEPKQPAGPQRAPKVAAPNEPNSPRPAALAFPPPVRYSMAKGDATNPPVRSAVRFAAPQCVLTGCSSRSHHRH